MTATKDQASESPPTDDDNALDTLRAGALRRVRVRRTEVHDLPPGEARTDWVGLAGYVSNREGFEADVFAQWGGGVYTFEGRGADGKPVVIQDVVIPGPSLPLYEEREEFVPRHGHAGFGGPPPGGGFASPPHHYPPPPAAPAHTPPWYAGYQHTSPEEVRMLRQELAEVKRERDALREDVRRFEREAEAAKHQAAIEKMHAAFNEKLNALVGGKGPDATAQILHALVTKSGKDEQAAAAQANQFMAMFQAMNTQQQQFLTQILTTMSQSKGAQGDLLTAMAALQKIQGNPIEQFAAMAETMERLGLGGGKDDDEEEEGSPLEKLGEALTKGAVKMFTTSDESKPAPPGPPVQAQVVQQAQPPPSNGNGNGHAKDKEKMGPVQMFQILALLLSLYEQKLQPDQAAESFKATLVHNKLGAAVPSMAAETVPSVLAKVKGAIPMAEAAGMADGVQVLRQVVALLDKPEGAAWAGKVLERLKAVGA